MEHTTQLPAGLWARQLQEVSWQLLLPSGKGRVPAGTHRLVGGERCVASHEEVQAWRGDERGNQPDQVVVHVARVPQRGGAGRHDGGDLQVGTGSAAALPRSTAKLCSAPGWGTGPRVLAAHCCAQPTEQVQPKVSSEGMPCASFSRGQGEASPAG